MRKRKKNRSYENLAEDRLAFSPSVDRISRIQAVPILNDFYA